MKQVNNKIINNDFLKQCKKNLYNHYGNITNNKYNLIKITTFFQITKHALYQYLKNIFYPMLFPNFSKNFIKEKNHLLE